MKSLSTLTKLYIFLTVLVGTVIFANEIVQVDFDQLGLLVVLCVLASLALILKVEGSTDRSHYTFSFIIYGFTFGMLGPEEAMLVITVSNIVEWIWNKPAWYIQLFNTCSYIIVMHVSGIIFHLIDPIPNSQSWQSVLGVMLGMAVFNLLNHLMVGIVVWLARGENLKQSGIFEFFPLMLDLSLLYLGASLAFVWNYNPFALGLFLIPVYLIYSTLKVPSLERQTEIDTKTGLFNHEYFKKHLKSELARANRFDRPLSIILADLDLLRNINNTYGHLAGDDVLIGIAKAMKNSVRDYDIVSRFGGEEFAILLPETSLSKAYERAEYLRKVIEDLEFIVPTSTTPIRATMSFGVAHREDFSQTEDQIVHNADLALYHSKLSGRNQTFIFVNDTYVEKLEEDADDNSTYVVPSSKTVEDEVVTNNDVSEITEVDQPSSKTVEKQVVAHKNVGNEKTPTNTKDTTPHVSLYIGLISILSIASFWLITRWIPLDVNIEGIDLVSLLIIIGLIVISEGFSIDLYTQRTSVSTSAIPILVSYLLFGPLGAVAASLVLAVSLAIKHRSAFSRFIFNFSNHLISGNIIIGIILLAGGNFTELTLLFQLVLCLLTALSLYLFTTTLVSIGMSLDLKEPLLGTWKLHFGWLLPYYVGIGFISFTMIFGYIHASAFGLIIMVVPMFLLRFSQAQYINHTKNAVAELREKNMVLKKTFDEIADINEGLLTTLAEIIDLRDPYVLGHSKQVSKYATDIAKQMNLNKNQVNLIRKAGLLHDIGKLGIPMEILTKPSKLTREEYEIIKEHAALGADIIKNSPTLRSLVPIIRHHHEYFNGKGYPDGISGNQISIEARIISVADAIEAMISDRPYRKSLEIDQVIDELRRNSGTQFDPFVVNLAISILESSPKLEKSASTRTDTQLKVSQKFSQLAQL